MRYNPKKLRHELKYFIHYHQYIELRERLQSVMQRDFFALEDGNYHVRSLYFDDAYDSALYEKSFGVFRRDKYRIRIYNKCDSRIKLERKSKYGQYIGKESVTLTRPQYDQIMDHHFSSLFRSNNQLLMDFCLLSVNQVLRPKVIVDYEREAYITNPGEVRITFDKMVRAGINSNDIFDGNLVTINAFHQPIMIMEVKFNEFLPENVRMLLQMDSHERAAISKYVICRVIKKNI